MSLLTPDGRMLTADDKGKKLKWFVSDQFDLITITDPASGEWQLKASTGKNKAYVITDLKQQLDIKPREPVINEGMLIKTWLEDKGAILNKPSIMQTLSVEMHVATPDGQTHELKMEPELAADGTPTHSGAYTSLIALPVEGSYHFKVITSTSTFSREKDSVVHAIAPPPAAEPAPLMKQPIEPAAKPVTPPEPAQQNTPAVTAEEHKPDAAPAKAGTEPKKVEHNKAKKPAKAPKKTANAKENNNEETHQDSGKTSVFTAIMIFLGINVLLSAIGGGVYFVIRWKRNRATASSDSDEEQAEESTAKEKRDDKKDKAA